MSPGLRSPLAHLRWDWAHAVHICAGTTLAPCHICAGTGLTPATSAPGLGSPLAHLRRDYARRLPHRARSWCRCADGVGPGHYLFACGNRATNDGGADTIARSLGLSAAATPASSCSAARRALAPTRSCSMHARWRMCASLATAWRLSAHRVARMVLRGAHAPHREEIAAAWLGLGTVPLRVHSREP